MLRYIKPNFMKDAEYSAGLQRFATNPPFSITPLLIETKDHEQP
jgi:hypothetical protein